MTQLFDVIVMGAGPGGSACGTFLAQAGLQTLIIEGEHHPRHHIGESLLPGSIPILNALGIPSQTLTDQFQPKIGARFYDPAADRLATFGFEPTPGSPTPSYQVLREDFDTLLAAQARAAGCTLWENASIESFDETLDHPKVLLRDGRSPQARFLIDASGRAALIAAKQKTKHTINDYGRLGIYNYFTNLPPHDDLDPDYITMYVFPGGWVWLIPLRDGRTSVGVVLHDPTGTLHPPTAGQTRPEALFWNTVDTMPRLAHRLRAAQPTDEFRAISDYSYTVDHRHGPNWAAIGDAAGFLDPIFSTGVHLALSSAQIAAGAISEKLRKGTDTPLRNYADHMHKGFQVFRAFVHRFYNTGLINNLIFLPNKPPHLHLAITRILAGFVWEENNPVIMMLRQ